MFFQSEGLLAVCYGSEAYLSSVDIMTDEMPDVAPDTFQVVIDADTPSNEICEQVKTRISVFNPVNVLAYDSPDHFEVCGPAYHPEITTFSLVAGELPDNHDGFFACSGATFKGNVSVDAFDSSLGPYGGETGTDQ